MRPRESDFNWGDAVRSCSTCIQPISKEPKCGLCCGPYSTTTRYERMADELRYNRTQTPQVQGKA